MKKNLFKLLLAIAAAALLAPSASAELYCENTPPENVFVVGDKSYILLDKLSDDYLILSKNFYDLRYYGGLADSEDSSKSWDVLDHYFDVDGTYDEYNIGHWLNTDFAARTDGSGLSPELLGYIPTAVWKTEACSPGSKCSVTEYGDVTRYYGVRAKIALPSREEINKYAAKIGYRDGADGDWWTRSRCYEYNGVHLVSTVRHENGAFGYRNGGKQLTRPIFRLNKSFFAENSLDISALGENVRGMLKSDFSRDELSAVYSEDDLDIIFREGSYTEPAAVIDSSRVYISGSLDTTHKNRNVSIMALKKGTDADNPTKSKILYLNQVQPNDNGEYELVFDCQNSDFELYISDGGKLKKQLLYKDYTQKHYISCRLSDAEYTDSYVYNVTAQLKNVFSDSEAVCDIYLAKYSDDGMLCGVEKQTFDLSENKEKNETLRFSADGTVSKVKAFVWSGMTPLTDEKTLLDADTNKITKLTSMADKRENIYTDSEQMTFTVKGEPGKTVRYSLHDFWGNEKKSGTFVLGEDSTNFTLDYGGYGYFVLSFKYEYYDIDNTVSQYLCRVTDENFDNVTDSPFGINAHLNKSQYGFDAMLVDYMALMGARSVRTGYSWSSAEKEKGVYSIDETGLAEMRKHNMRMNLATGYGNELYNGQKWFPWSDEGRKAFSAYQLGVMNYVGDLVDEVDIWNEWYGGGDKNNWYYYALLKECYAPLKAKYPNVKVLSNSSTEHTGNADSGWYDKLLGFGALDYADGIYPHIYYGSSDPETEILYEKDFYDTVHKKYGKENVKMYLTETGATTAKDTGVSEEEQASRLVRAYALGLACGFEKIYWYDFMNDGLTASDGEDNFGLVRHKLDSKGRFTPKPAYAAYAVMARQLTSYACTGMRMIDSDICCVTFEKGGDIINVIWSLSEKTLQLGSEMTWIDIMGESFSASEINVGKYPIYLHGTLM